MAAIPRAALVRLVASLLGMLGSVWFVVNYTKASKFRFCFEHEGGHLNAINTVLVDYGTWLYVFPMISLALGLWSIYRRSYSSAAFEILLSVTWLLSLGMAGFCLLSWQIQNVPIFSHMEWHF